MKLWLILRTLLPCWKRHGFCVAVRFGRGLWQNRLFMASVGEKERMVAIGTWPPAGFMGRAR